PPITMPGTGFVYTDCSGICRGIWLVLTGCSIPRFLKPKKAPTKVNGKDIQSHMASKAIKVANGTAAELLFTHKMTFIMKNKENTTPGQKSAVISTLSFQR